MAALVATEAARDSAAATQAGRPAPFAAIHSDPVLDDGSLVAVVAFSYEPGGHPVQVLGYHAGSWSQLAALLSPSGQPGANIPAGVLYLLPNTPVSVADVTGDGRPDFLIFLEAADNTPGVVVSQDGGSWRYVPFNGPGSGGDVVARNPRFQGNTLLSTYDNCSPDCAQGANSTVVWTYVPSSGEFVATPSSS